MLRTTITAQRTLRFHRPLSTTPIRPSIFQCSPPPSPPPPSPPASFDPAIPFLTLRDTLTSQLKAKSPPPEPVLLEALAALQHHACQSPSPDHANLAYELISQPKTFLTPALLDSFTNLCALSKTPELLPPVFAKYSPNAAPKNAIPQSTASAALNAAIAARELVIALDIIDLSVGSPAFRSRKVFTQVVPALALVGGVLPAGLWAVAEQMAQWQEMVDISTARGYAFAGLACYVVMTGSIGAVAVATANDQMMRVTWEVGTPLRERWVKEEERAAYDAVAVAWGFKAKRRWGEETGEEWELLKEVVGRKGMVLDQSNLLEGMQ